MPVNFRDIFEEMLREEQEAATQAQAGVHVGAGRWAKLFTAHPEGAGPFGGRNNAAVRLVGFFRAKAFPYEAALFFAQEWNRKFCTPPIPERELSGLISRGWAEWTEGGIADRAPDAKKGAICFLTIAQMEEEQARVGSQQWLIPNGIPERGLVYITAPPAGGKTWVLLDLVRAAARGDQWLGQFEIEQTPTLYLDEEMGVAKALPRLKKLGVPRDVPFYYTNRLGIRMDDNDQLRQIREHIEAHEIRLVIIDTLTRVHRYDENDNSQMRQLFARFQVLMNAGASVVVAHHDRKGGQGDSSIGHERMRGASEISAAADMCFSIEKNSDWFRLVSTKSRLVPEAEAISIDFVVEDSADRLQTTLRPIDPEERSTRRLDVMGERILAVLWRDGEMNTRTLVEAVGGKTEVVVAAADRLVEMGSLSRREASRGAKIYAPI